MAFEYVHMTSVAGINSRIADHAAQVFFNSASDAPRFSKLTEKAGLPRYVNNNGVPFPRGPA